MPVIRFDGDNPPSIKEDGLWNIGIWLQDEAGNTSEMTVKEFKGRYRCTTGIQ